MRYPNLLLGACCLDYKLDAVVLSELLPQSHRAFITGDVPHPDFIASVIAQRDNPFGKLVA